MRKVRGWRTGSKDTRQINDIARMNTVMVMSHFASTVRGYRYRYWTYNLKTGKQYHRTVPVPVYIVRASCPKGLRLFDNLTSQNGTVVSFMSSSISTSNKRHYPIHFDLFQYLLKSAIMRLFLFLIAVASVEAFVVARTHRPPTMALRSENGSGMARVSGLVAAVSVFSLSSPPSIASDLQVPAGKLSIDQVARVFTSKTL